MSIILRRCGAGPQIERVRPQPSATNVVLGWNDLGKGAVISASSQQGTLPAANIALGRMGKKWRSSAAPPAWIVADLGQLAEVGLVMLQATNATRSTTATVRVADNDPTAQAASAVPMSLDTRTGHMLALPARIGRYVRIEIVDPTLSYVEAGRLWVSNAWRPLRNFAFGVEWGGIDLSTRTETRGGQVFVDALPPRRTLSLSLQGLDDADAATTLRWAFEIGLSRDLLVVTQPAAPCPAQHALLGVPIEPWRVARPDPARWTSSVALMERL